MELTAKRLREAIKDLDDDEPIYIEKACNLTGARGAFDTQKVYDRFPLTEVEKEKYHVYKNEDGIKYIYQDAYYLEGFQARFTEILTPSGELAGVKIFVIEANY